MIALRQLVREEVQQLLERFVTAGNHRRRWRGGGRRRRREPHRVAPV